MPRRRRSDSEIEAVRERILDETLDLFAVAGWEGFSMRKLAARLNIAAKTLYNYFGSQDDLYLRLLTRGFRQLYSALSSAAFANDDPRDRLSALAEVYVDFAFTHVNLYNLMFVWHVPKYDDYVGTSMENVALTELAAALDNQRLLAATISECIGHAVDEDDLRFMTIWAWSQLHGYVAAVNNNLIGYMHPDPAQIHTRMLQQVRSIATAEMAAALAGRDDTASASTHSLAPTTPATEPG
jgi:AcrR family transcriptional regulator